MSKLRQSMTQTTLWEATLLAEPFTKAKLRRMGKAYLSKDDGDSVLEDKDVVVQSDSEGDL